MNDTLKHAEIYYLNGVPYMKLVYEYTDDKGTHKVTIPRLDFPHELTLIPNIHIRKKYKMKSMTISELKNLIMDIPDDIPVIIHDKGESK